MATNQNRNDYDPTSDTDKSVDPEETEKKNIGIGGARKKSTSTKKNVDQKKKSEIPEMKQIKEMFKQFKTCQIEKKVFQRVKTENFLEVQCDTVDTSERGFQTELEYEEQGELIEGSKFGIDRSTQLNPREIFDFDAEVSPISNLVSSKIIEQSNLEVLEEEATSLFDKESRKLEYKKEQQYMEIKNLEKEEQLKQQKKDMTIQEIQKKQKARKDLEQRIYVEHLIRSQVEIMLPSIVEELKQEDLEIDVENILVPWIVQEVEVELMKSTRSKEVIDEMIHHILNKKVNLYITQKKSELKKSTRKKVKFVGNLLDYVEKK